MERGESETRFAARKGGGGDGIRLNLKPATALGCPLPLPLEPLFIAMTWAPKDFGLGSRGDQNKPRGMQKKETKPVPNTLFSPSQIKKQFHFRGRFLFATGHLQDSAS